MIVLRALSLFVIHQDRPGLPRGLESLGAFDGSTHVVAGCVMAVLGPGRSACSGAARLVNTGRAEQVGTDVPEPPADPDRVRRSGLAGFSQGRRRFAAGGPDDTELSVSEDHEPMSTGLRPREHGPRGVPAERLSSEPEVVLKIKPSE